MFDLGATHPRLWEPIDGVNRQVETIHVVEHGHVERRRDRALLLVAANVKILVVRSPIREPVNERRITVIREDNRLVRGEQRIEVGLRQAVGMLARLRGKGGVPPTSGGWRELERRSNRIRRQEIFEEETNQQ